MICKLTIILAVLIVGMAIGGCAGDSDSFGERITQNLQNEMPPPACAESYAQMPDGTCACPADTVETDGKCVTPQVACTGGRELAADGTCACPGGMVESGGACVMSPVVCEGGRELAADGACVCPSGMVESEGGCVTALVVCDGGRELVAGGTCVCPAGMVESEEGCARPHLLHGTVLLGGTLPPGTGIEIDLSGDSRLPDGGNCPAGQYHIGEECVEGNTVINIPDVRLKTAMRAALRLKLNVEITAERCARLDNLNVRNYGIEDISGIECATSMTDLNLSSNNIINISPLVSLPSLERLVLNGCPLI